MELKLVFALVFALVTIGQVETHATASHDTYSSDLRLHKRLLKDGFGRKRGVLVRDVALVAGAHVMEAARLEAAMCQNCTSSDDITNEQCFGCERTGSSVGAKSFLRARRLERLDSSGESRIKQLIRSPVLARLAATAMAVPAVRLYQATAFVKEHGDAPSGWHQDAAACPLHTDKIVTLWVALDDVSVEAGPLHFLKGSHLPGLASPPSLRDLTPSKRLALMGKWTDDDVTRLTGLNISKAKPLSAGDVTLHLGWTLHAAGPNTDPSGKPRPALAITYFADGARVHPHVLKLLDGSVHPSQRDTYSDPIGDAKGIRLSAADGGGPPLLVRLLADDASTWMPWLRSRPPVLVPGAPVRDDVLTPILWDVTWKLDKDHDHATWNGDEAEL